MKRTLSHKDTGGQADRKHYRTELPNLIDDLGLDVYEFRLYAHIKRVAGETGFCNQNNETMAKACGFSHPIVIRAKKSLAEPRSELGGKSLITRQGKNGKTIRLVDVWSENLMTYKKSSIEATENSKADLASDNKPDLLNSKSYLPNSKSGLHKERTYKEEHNKERERENTLSGYNQKQSFNQTDNGMESTKMKDIESASTTISRQSKSPRAMLPEDFEPNLDMFYWAAKNHRNISAKDATAKFINHHRARSIKLADWNAEWRKWIANERPSANRSPEEIEHEAMWNEYGAEAEVEEYVANGSDNYLVSLDEVIKGLPELSAATVKDCLKMSVRVGNTAITGKGYYYAIHDYEDDAEYKNAIDNLLKESADETLKNQIGPIIKHGGYIDTLRAIYGRPNSSFLNSLDREKDLFAHVTD